MMAKKKKKKGRPSLLDLQKRFLKQQQSPNPSRRSSRGDPSFDATPSPPPPEFIAGDDDEDERKEKKHKLLLGLNSNSDCYQTTLSPNPFGSVSNADNEDPDDASKRRKLSAFTHRSNQMGEKGLKATDSSVHGLQVESGPTTPLPDKKLLVFILDRLQKKDTYGVFSEPVDREELPEYHEIIENPMDFATVRKKLDCGVYTNLELFEKDVFLICSNAMEYNSPDTIYFRQARTMQELAKKDFENLRQDSDDCETPPKIRKRGRPPGKKLTKLTNSSYESFSDTTPGSVEENTNGSSAYNLRKGPNSSKFNDVDAVNGVFQGSLIGKTCTNWLSDWENEFPASVLRSVIKYGKKHFAVDEYKRDTYRFPLPSGYEPSTLAALEGEQKQLIEVDDAYLEHSYARSIARFVADLGPVVRKIALKKIGSIFPVELKSGPGSTGENMSSENERSLLTTGLLPQNISGSNSVGAKRYFLQGREGVETINTQRELTSLNSNCGGMGPVTPFLLQQNSSSQPCINGSSNGLLVSYILPQMGMLRPAATMMGNSVPAEASVPRQILDIASTSNTTISPSPVYITGTDSFEANLVATARTDCGSLLAHGFGIGSFRAPELGDASFQELTRHHKQDSNPFLPELPDFALQLRMGR
ncbi:Bromodomain containing protein [Parasponia andersonii]|uniref:Bromodomain containing protein n=1 Tax=Parasponia andersonii TaxID=3476 RepID=A0A2P5ACP8_PARAD|nr:Bromodomain containing protein [Parasponia andersonii]